MSAKDTGGGSGGAPGGTLWIVSAPSGAGKTSLVQAALGGDARLALSVSYTTRAQRPGERPGVDYHFVAPERFTEMAARGEFLERAEVFGHHYGTARARVLEHLQRRLDVILEIDWQGARQVREAFPGCLSVFILPPSREVLEARLRGRGQDDEAVIARRMRDAVREMSHYEEYDYLVVNDEFPAALADLRAVFAAGRLRRSVQVARCEDLLAALLAETT